MLWSFTIGIDTDDNNFSSVVNESRNRGERRSLIVRLRCFHVSIRMPNHDTFLWKTACVSASARVPNSFVRDFKRQAAELRRTGREVARGLKRKNRWGFPRETSPLVSVALLPLFPLSTPKKLLAFEHGRDRYKLRRAALDWHSREIYLWVQSLNPPFRPLCLILGRIQ